MGVLTRLVDRALPPSPELVAAREATGAQWINAAHEAAAGVDEETDTYLALNCVTNDAIDRVPRGQRWRIWPGADEIRNANLDVEEGE